MKSWLSILKPLEYRSKVKVKFATIDAAKAIEDLSERTKLLFNGADEAGDFYRRIFADVFAMSPNVCLKLPMNPTASTMPCGQVLAGSWVPLKVGTPSGLKPDATPSRPKA